MAKIRKAPRAKSGYLVQTVLFYDGPQITLFQSDRGFPMIGLAFDDDDSDYDFTYPMLFSELSENDYQRYLNQTTDLRYIFAEAPKKLYVADWDTLQSGGLRLKVVNDPSTVEQHFPSTGFWARDHNISLSDQAFAPNAVAQIAIDGNWEATDFAKITSQFADIYAFFAVTSKRFAATLSPSALSTVVRSVSQLNWVGGGSYVSFYDRIFQKFTQAIPLGVKKIQYASPGVIELKGQAEALEAVLNTINLLDSNFEELNEKYKKIDAGLGIFNLRTAPVETAKFPTKQHEEDYTNLCQDLLTKIGTSDFDNLFEMSNNNPVLLCKITTSYYRRAKKLHKFCREGRVGQITVSSMPS